MLEQPKKNVNVSRKNEKKKEKKYELKEASSKKLGKSFQLISRAKVSFYFSFSLSVKSMLKR